MALKNWFIAMKVDCDRLAPGWPEVWFSASLSCAPVSPNSDTKAGGSAPPSLK